MRDKHTLTIYFHPLYILYPYLPSHPTQDTLQKTTHYGFSSEDTRKNNYRRCIKLYQSSNSKEVGGESEEGEVDMEPKCNIGDLAAHKNTDTRRMASDHL